MLIFFKIESPDFLMPVIDDGAAAEGCARVVASEEGGLSCTAFCLTLHPLGNVHFLHYTCQGYSFGSATWPPTIFPADCFRCPQTLSRKGIAFSKVKYRNKTSMAFYSKVPLSPTRRRRPPRWCPAPPRFHFLSFFRTPPRT